MAAYPVVDAAADDYSTELDELLELEEDELL